MNEEELTQRVAELEAEVTKLAQQLDDANGTISDLEDELKAAESSHKLAEDNESAIRYAAEKAADLLTTAL